MTLEADECPDAPEEVDPRATALRQRLNEALFEVNHGEYFRARVHGWVAYNNDDDVELPVGVAERLCTQFNFDRDEDAGGVAAVDAFVIAYHAAETFWRYLFAILDGSGPTRAPLMSMAGLKAGKTFNDRIDTYRELNIDDVHELLDFAFLPPEVQVGWEGEPTLDEVRSYLTSWWRALGSYVKDWRNAYNAAKHGLAVGVRPVQLTFLQAEGGGAPIDFMNGPVMRTLEHEVVTDANGRRVKDPATRQSALRWFWMDRAIDPDELIAQTVVTADLLDWLRAIAASRLLGRTGTHVHVRAEPKPLTLKRKATPGISFRMDLATLPIPLDEAAQALARAQGETEGDDADEQVQGGNSEDAQDEDE